MQIQLSIGFMNQWGKDKYNKLSHLREETRVKNWGHRRPMNKNKCTSTCENLEGRLDAVEKNILEKEDQAKKVPAEKQLAKKEKETVEKNILEKEDRAKKALAEKQLVMEKVVQEGNFLKQPEEENSELGDYLLDRVHVDDFVQEEISLVMEDMKLLKAKFDELHSLSKYLSFSQTTTCNLTAAFSSSPKSMAPEQVDEAIVQAGPSETAEKTNHLPYVTRTIRPIRDS